MITPKRGFLVLRPPHHHMDGPWLAFHALPPGMNGLWHAFHALPPGTSPHDHITREAALTAGWPAPALGALLETVRRPDLEEHEFDLHPSRLVHLAPGPSYAPHHHADRPDAHHGTALAAAARYIEARRRAAAQARDAASAVRALGQALHAVQDAFAHSSYVDLDGPRRRAFRAALLEGGPVPPGVHLTTLTGERDAYTHADHAKDAPRANAESMAPLGGTTKYDAAHDAAVQASHIVISSFLIDQDAEAVRRLTRLRAPWPIARPLLTRRLTLAAGVAAGAAAAMLIALLAWRGSR